MPFQNASRLIQAELEVRTSGPNAGRTISGIACPFDEPTPIQDYAGKYTETIRQGAFARTVHAGKPERVKFLWGHERTAPPIGHATLLREDSNGLYAEFAVSATPRGDEVLQLVRDGSITGLSIGFGIEKDRWSKMRDQREVLAAKLLEVSAVNWPAYAGATITGVRSDNSLPSAEQLRMRARVFDMKLRSFK